MRKLLFHVSMIVCIFSGMNVKEGMTQCWQCGPGTFGGAATGTGAYAVGWSANATGDTTIAIGYKNAASAGRSIVLGNVVQATAVGSMTIGSGVFNTSTLLSNGIANSLMIGMNSNVPTIFVESSSGAGTWGNVGIGTTSPQGILHVRDENGSNSNLVIDRNGTAQANLLFNSGGTTPIARIGVNGTGANHLHYDLFQSGGSHIFYVNTSEEVMRIIGNTGNVAIGSQSASGRLHVNHATANTDVVIQRNGSNSARLRFHNGSTAAANLSLTSSNDLLIQNLSSNKDLLFNVNDGGVDTEVMRVVGSTARVGIGTIAPFNRLHVEGANIENGILRVTVAGAPSGQSLLIGNMNSTPASHFEPYILGRTDRADDSGLWLWAETPDEAGPPAMVFRAAVAVTSGQLTQRPLFTWTNGGSTRMRMDAAGNLGIGTTAPSGRLHVAGTAFVNTLPPAFETPVGWIATGTNQFQLVDNSGSSIHFKENVNELEFDHEAFLSLQPKRYNWKPALGGKPSVGFIAQEAWEVFPELADIRPKHTINDDGTLVYDSLGQALVDTTQLEPYGFQYHKLPIYTFAIVQQLHADNLQNRQRIDALEQQLAQCCANPQLRQSQPEQVEPAKRIVPTIEPVALTSSPNPFSDYSDIRATIPQSAKSSSLIIVNAQGAVVLHSTLSSGQSETIRIYTSEIGVGLFTCYLLLDSDIAASCKVISTK
jgi:hypothetical protein